jgi:hypothetical protein
MSTGKIDDYTTNAASLTGLALMTWLSPTLDHLAQKVSLSTASIIWPCSNGAKLWTGCPLNAGLTTL